jgi:hypothetical protein
VLDRVELVEPPVLVALHEIDRSRTGGSSVNELAGGQCGLRHDQV